MDHYLLILEIVSGTCCILSAVFLHYFISPKRNRKHLYQAGCNLLKSALLILGGSAIVFAFTGGIEHDTAKSNFIQILLPVETLLVFGAMVYLINENERLKKFMWIQAFCTFILCASAIIYIYGIKGEPGEWFYYLLVSCYIGQFVYYTYIYTRVAKFWQRRHINDKLSRKWYFRVWISAFIIGVMGIIVEIYPHVACQYAFTLGYTLFFIFFTIQYHNYGVEFGNVTKKEAFPTAGENTNADLLPEKERHEQNNDIIKEKILLWKKTKGYLQVGVTIQDISRKIGINRTYLSSYINETYQTNFNGWINNLRIEEAKQRLIDAPDINLSDLAESVGFADQAHFSKQFKQKEGVPPSVWKREHCMAKEKAS